MKLLEVSPVAHAAASVQLTRRQHGLSSIQVQVLAQTHHQMVRIVSRQHSALHGQMERSLWFPVLAKQSVQTSLLQLGLRAVQKCAIHLRLANIVQETTSARHGTAAALLLFLILA
jgi:hypothetical protein